MRVQNTMSVKGAKRSHQSKLSLLVRMAAVHRELNELSAPLGPGPSEESQRSHKFATRPAKTGTA